MCPVCQARFLRIVQDIICSGSSIIMKETVLVAMVSVYLMKFRASLNFFFCITVFIYSMPGYSVSIKERMLYSSCKNSVVDVMERIYSIPIDKKVEVDSGAELTEEFLMVQTF